MRFSWSTAALSAVLIIAVSAGAAAQDSAPAEVESASSSPTPYVGVSVAGVYELASSDPLVPLASPSTKETLSFGLDSKYFDIIGTMSANSDGKISPESANL